MQIKGLKIQDILSLNPNELNNMLKNISNEDLSKVTGRLVSASNKRLRRLEKNELGRFSPAYVNTMKGGYFSTGARKGETGMNYRNRLLNTFSSTRQFLQMKTSTITGWKEVRSDIERRLGGSLNHNQSVKFWKAYRELEARAGNLIVSKEHTKSGRNSDRVQKMLYKTYKSRTFRTSTSSNVDIVLDNLKSIYEEEKNRQKSIQQAEEKYIETGEEPEDFNFEDLDIDM